MRERFHPRNRSWYNEQDRSCQDTWQQDDLQKNKALNVNILFVLILPASLLLDILSRYINIAVATACPDFTPNISSGHGFAGVFPLALAGKRMTVLPLNLMPLLSREELAPLSPRQDVKEKVGINHTRKKRRLATSFCVQPQHFISWSRALDGQ